MSRARPSAPRIRTLPRRAAPALTACALAVAALLGAVAPVRALVDDDMVPAGRWVARATYRSDTQKEAYARTGQLESLKNYVLPFASIRADVEGDIERSVIRLDTRLTLGLTDVWNLSLYVPFLQVEQISTLSTTSTIPSVTNALVGLESRSDSGLGDIVLTSMHRPLFSDWNGVVWGYGLIVPAQGLATPYRDSTTLDLVRPMPAAHSFIHYTRYTAIPRSRFDLRLDGEMTFEVNVDSVSGEEKTLHPGNRAVLRLGWTQEFGAVVAGLELEELTYNENTLANKRLGDSVHARTVRINLGLGSLIGLESGPVAFPYLAQLQVERVIQGFNVPAGDTMTLSLQTFF